MAATPLPLTTGQYVPFKVVENQENILHAPFLVSVEV